MDGNILLRQWNPGHFRGPNSRTWDIRRGFCLRHLVRRLQRGAGNRNDRLDDLVDPGFVVY